ncbi:MAG TPA: HisA/HisF-related TIM barrel protein [Methanoregulaceae archaeon]|nr:HisA/HisF-related TIM barrel protein [Methanoregulaceae archaeon]
MELVLAMDLKAGLVVHGEKGNRSGYRPLTWGASPVADPIGFLSHIRPVSLYIADLDRISGTGSHDAIIRECNALVRHCYADRGCRGPDDLMDLPHFENIIGTETCGDDLQSYHGGYLSIDMKNGAVIPSGADPAEFLSTAASFDFKGCILLDISAVGTSQGLTEKNLSRFREAYTGKLLWGGGVASVSDLRTLLQAGFDGAIVATALHKGKIPLDLIREGELC